MIRHIGFACKWIDTPDQVNGVGAKDPARVYNTGTTTITWLNRQTREVAEQKLWDLLNQNIQATYKLVEKVSTLDEHLRMVRLSSDILPAYTHDDWTYFWSLADVRLAVERGLAPVGELARRTGVRLSFHPGQFTVLASESDAIVQRSIAEFEYHTDMARALGYGSEFHDYGFKINVHISGKRGAQGIRDVMPRLSPEARNLITIENEENSHGLEDCLTISDVVPIVLDIHHHWIRSGEYIQANDSRVQQVIDSWRGVRPTCHYSISREDYLIHHDVNTRPDHSALLESGYKKQHLRAHSDFYWNLASNDWALTFLDKFDIMCESKAKNLASSKLAERARELGLL